MRGIKLPLCYKSSIYFLIFFQTNFKIYPRWLPSNLIHFQVGDHVSMIVFWYTLFISGASCIDNGCHLIYFSYKLGIMYRWWLPSDKLHLQVEHHVSMMAAIWYTALTSGGSWIEDECHLIHFIYKWGIMYQYGCHLIYLILKWGILWPFFFLFMHVIVRNIYEIFLNIFFDIYDP